MAYSITIQSSSHDSTRHRQCHMQDRDHAILDIEVHVWANALSLAGVSWGST